LETPVQRDLLRQGSQVTEQDLSLLQLVSRRGALGGHARMLRLLPRALEPLRQRRGALRPLLHWYSQG
jgi:hypothetical protein